MEHCAIDLGGTESQVCIRSEDGSIILERRYTTAKLESVLEKRGPSRVIVETSAEAFHVADQALAAGHEVRVVPATLVRSLGVGARGVKNDRRDAQILSEVSCRIDLPSVHVPSNLSRELKSMCGARDALIRVRTKLVNNVRGWMRTRLWRLRTGSTATFPSRVRKLSESMKQPLPEYCTRILTLLDTLNEEILASDRQVKKAARENEVCRRLMSVPGVGPVTAIRFVASLDEYKRFPKRSRGWQLSRPDTGRAFQRRTTTSDRNHEGRFATCTLGSSPSCLVRLANKTVRSDGALGSEDCSPAREKDRYHRARTKNCRRTVRHLARRVTLLPRARGRHPQQTGRIGGYRFGLAKDLAQSSTWKSTSNDCPEAMIAGGGVRLQGPPR